MCPTILLPPSGISIFSFVFFLLRIFVFIICVIHALSDFYEKLALRKCGPDLSDLPLSLSLSCPFISQYLSSLDPFF